MLPRIDMRPKVTGSAKYIEDLPEPAGLLYGAVLTSPYSHANIVSIDSSEADRLPGVVGVLHRDHLGDFYPLRPLPRNEHFKLTQDQPFIAIDKVRFNGEVVAIVAAEDLRTAQRAVDLIDVVYEPLPHVYDGSEALGAGAPLMHEQKGTNLLAAKTSWNGAISNGDLRRRTASSRRLIVSGDVSSSHGECRRLYRAIRRWENRSFGADQRALSRRQRNRPFLQIGARRCPPEGALHRRRLRLEKHHQCASGRSFLSRKIGGRPIKLVPSAEESFNAKFSSRDALRGENRHEARRTITALQVEFVVNTGAYTTGAATATHNAVISGWGCYRVPNLKIHGRCAYTNKVPAGTYPRYGKGANHLGGGMHDRQCGATTRYRPRRRFDGKTFWSEASLLPKERRIWIRISWSLIDRVTQPSKIR